jgi:hypothetical protein
MSARTKSQPHNANSDAKLLDSNSSTLSKKKLAFDDINMDELQKKFQMAKDERKRVQKEEERLKQRLNCLHSEEKRDLSKIELTKKSMKNLRENKQSFEENKRVKKEAIERSKAEEEALKEQAKLKREQLKENLTQSKTLKDIKSMNTNINNKEEQKQNKKIQILNKLEDILKNATLHQSVRAMENLIEEKRKREVLEKKIRLKEELMEKLKREEITKKNLDYAVDNLHKEEAELAEVISSNDRVDELKSKKKINVTRK